MLKALAEEGRTVFVSSHLMSEMAQTATRLVVVGRGRLIADTTVEEFIAMAGGSAVTVRSPEATALRELLLAPGVTVTSAEPGLLRVVGLTAEQIGDTAWKAHLPIHELAAHHASLEDAFIELTDDAVEYRTDREACGMSTTITDASATADTVPLRVTQSRVVHSEWTKFYSVRSTIWTLLVAVVLTVGLGAIIGAVTGNDFNSMSAANQVQVRPDLHIARRAQHRRVGGRRAWLCSSSPANTAPA